MLQKRQPTWREFRGYLAKVAEDDWKRHYEEDETTKKDADQQCIEMKKFRVLRTFVSL